ncbi:MAG: DNA-formamidopyrimidine glycosylase family protein, partial [Bryobacteraceae bacterium]
MPELPDIVVYVEALEARILGQRLERVRVASPFLVRTVSPALDTATGRTVRAVRRVGKRIALGTDGGPWLVLHLMIAGRLHWGKPRKKFLASLDFPNGHLTLTEAGSERRAALHVVADPESLDAGGIDVLVSPLPDFARALSSENHTLKRALTDP